MAIEAYIPEGCWLNGPHFTMEKGFMGMVMFNLRAVLRSGIIQKLSSTNEVIMQFTCDIRQQAHYAVLLQLWEHTDNERLD